MSNETAAVEEDAAREQADASAEPRPSVSELLIAAREARNLTQVEVADELFLTATFIRYIDEGEFRKIPKPAFVKGYLRSYARVVGLDGDAIVQAYDREMTPDQDHAEIRDVTNETVGPVTFTGPVLQTGLLALGALLVIIALVWIFSGGDDSQTSEPAGQLEPAPELSPSRSNVARDSQAPAADLDDAGATDADADDPLPVDGAFADEVAPFVTQSGGARAFDSAAEVARVESNDVAQTAIALVADARSRSTDTPAVSESEGAVAIDRSEGDDARLISVDSGGPDELVLSFSDDCWVEIEDKSRVLIYADLNRKDDVMTVAGAGPFTVLLGKVTAVAMSVNGDALNLAPYARGDDTAKVRTR